MTELATLRNQIEEKERELSLLHEKYNEVVETEKSKVLKAKSHGMSKTKYLLGFEFKSSSRRTPQYIEFYRVFKREFTALLKSFCSDIQIGRPNHFDVTGFFKTKKGVIYYFSLGDLRWNKDSMLIRTAKDFNDYTGGKNNDIGINNLEEEIKPFLEASAGSVW